MSVSSPRSDGVSEDDKASLMTNVADRPGAMDELLVARGPAGEKDGIASKSGIDASIDFLRAPTSGPIRPLSPDTVSNLSADGYDQIQFAGQAQRNADVEGDSDSPRPHSRWRAGFDAFWRRNKGLVYMVIAQICGTLMNVTTRLLEVEGNNGKGMHPFQILFARMGITAVLASLWMWWNRTPHFPFGMPEVRWLLVARGFGGFFGVFGMYYSLLYLPLADATVITFLAPALACWACSLLINEPFTRSEQVAALVSLVGVVLIARPTALFAHTGDAPPASGNGDMSTGINSTVPAGHAPPDASSYDDVTPMQRLSAVGVAMLGVFGAATAYTTIRWIGKRAHPLISVNYFAVWCTFVSTIAQLALPGVGFLLPSTLKDWAYLTFLGACGFILQFLLATALAYEKSSRATNMTYTQMLFALAFDKIIFGHTPGWVSIIGSSLILGSAIFVAVQKDASKNKQINESSASAADEESQRGLISGMDNENHEMNSHDRMPVQEVQMRTLR